MDTLDWGQMDGWMDGCMQVKGKGGDDWCARGHTSAGSFFSMDGKINGNDNEQEYGRVDDDGWMDRNTELVESWMDGRMDRTGKQVKA